MRIALDLTAWSNRRGFGRLTRGLVRALLERPGSDEYLLLVDDPQAEGLPAGGRLVPVDTTEPASRGLRDRRRRRFGSLLALRRAAAAERPDWLVYPSVYSYFPAPAGCRVAVLIPDVIPEEWPRHVFPHWPARLLWRLKSRAARRRADAVLTLSDYARDGLRRRFGLDPASVWVVEPAPEPIFRPLADHELDRPLLARLGLGEGALAIAYLGGLNPHKNLPALIDALAALRRRPALARLRIVFLAALDDPFTPGREAILERVRSRGLEEAVSFPGYLEDADVVQALNAATVLALPSLAEGFGLPAVEAAACGTPVVATRRSPLPEILAGGGLFVDPERTDELVEALAAVLEDPAHAARLGAAGRERATRLSWERSADRFLAALASAGPAGR